VYRVVRSDFLQMRVSSQLMRERKNSRRSTSSTNPP
jgi:hypothetical protein